MDNLAHGLAGAALGEAGLKKKTGLGMATLIIAANLPDVDALGLLFGENLAWRRGWTHGLVLPPLLVGAMVLFDRWQARRGARPAERLPIHVGWLLALAYIGWASHPLLDFMNTYGIRLLMPFSERWFYGDTLFIIDVWLWTALAIGVWLSRRRRRRGSAHPGRPALMSLCVAAAYTTAMGVSSIAAERLTREVAQARGHGPIRTVVASPVPINPFRRDVVFSTDDGYGFGVLRWTPSASLHLAPGLIGKNMDHPAVAEARQEKPIADFLYWSRLPFATVEHRVDGTIVTIADARYSNGATPGRFVRTLRLPPAVAPNQLQRAPDSPQPDKQHGAERR
ncbi:MAG TPA: metal-dependent hydrolase [Beijerinckiaceae bacterium]|nr:metal-dependent hydrolase [Beijerinckiaceae bacterium]